MTMHLLENTVLSIRVGTEDFKTVEPERMPSAVRNIYARLLPGPREEVVGEKQLQNYKFDGVINRAKEKAYKRRVKREIHLLAGYPLKAVAGVYQGELARYPGCRLRLPLAAYRREGLEEVCVRIAVDQARGHGSVVP